MGHLVARGVRLALVACVLGVLAAPAAVRAAAPPAPAALSDRPASGTNWQGRDRDTNIPMRVTVTPSPAKLGQRLTYRGMVRAEPGVVVRFVPPQSAGALTWGKARAGREKHAQAGGAAGGAADDSVWFETTLQVFETGMIPVPGPAVQLSRMPGTSRAGTARLPTVRVQILPTITAADSNAELRGLHGPLAAPWWERVPWLPIFVVLLLVAVFFIVRKVLRGRKPRRVVAPVVPAAPARPRLDIGAEALRALAALRARELPGQGRFGEHALELTAILRRFLEATVTTPRPGDTSGELLERLKSSRMPEDDYERLEGLLALWDRVKFARAPLTVEEATRCEDAVEAYVRRVQQARLEAAQAAARAAAARAAQQGGSAGPTPPSPPPGAPEAA